MKYSVAAATLVALASAQGLGDIPSCAVPCLGDAASAAGCDESDIACLCKNVETIQMQAASCVIEECGQDKALNEVLPAAKALCENSGSGMPSSMPTMKTSMESKPPMHTSNTMTPHPTGQLPTGNNTQAPPQPTSMPPVTGGAGAVGASLAMLALGALAL